MTWRTVAILILALAPAAATVAEEPFGLNLFSPNSLAGWDHSPEPVAGWTMEGTTLRGSQRSTPLLSGWTFGDFELRFRYRGNWETGFPQVPNGQAITYRLPGSRPQNGGQSSTAVIRRRFGLAGAAFVDIERGTRAEMDWC